uniref:VWFA domain-containing protein n=1 Tax=Chlamydomonas euryale TaxID=1486919 RepID=A0A7R9VNQ3_9CHLO
MACQGTTCSAGQPKPIINAKTYMKTVVGSLGLSTSSSLVQATLVTFDSGVYRPLAWTNNATAMNTAIDGLCNGNQNTCSGYTNIAGGLQDAFTLLSGIPSSFGGAKVVILLTDGQGNRPIPSTSNTVGSNPVAYQAAMNIKGSGATLISLGFNGAILTALNGYASVDPNCVGVASGRRHVYAGATIDDLESFLQQIAKAICGDNVECASPPLDQPACNTERSAWDDVNTQCGTECRAQINQFSSGIQYRTCTNFCAGVGRKCVSGSSSCTSGTTTTCNTIRSDSSYTCRCGDPLYF